MEELILIVVVAVLALIAIGQCAHHSSRRRGSLDLPVTQHGRIDTAHVLNPPAGAERAQEPASAVVAEREPVNGGSRPA